MPMRNRKRGNFFPGPFRPMPMRESHRRAAATVVFPILRTKHGGSSSGQAALQRRVRLRLPSVERMSTLKYWRAE
jgi:hypothetical protein